MPNIPKPSENLRNGLQAFKIVQKHLKWYILSTFPYGPRVLIGITLNQSVNFYSFPRVWIHHTIPYGNIGQWGSMTE